MKFYLSKRFGMRADVVGEGLSFAGKDQGETYWSILTHSIWVSSMFRSFFGCFRTGWPC